MSKEPRRLAVVLFNLGGPDRLEAVRPFLRNLFADPAIIDLPAPLRKILAELIARSRNAKACANYAVMGGASPLLANTRAQALALQAALQDRADSARVFVGMRYWEPFIDEVAKDVAAFAPTDVVLAPLFPQFSTTTSGSALAAWRGAYRGPGRTHGLCCWFANRGFIEAHVGAIKRTWETAGRPQARLLFSA
ncbi:MAG TPA: ferrochelatase, partial [Caulobacteraceae bacterium]